VAPFPYLLRQGNRDLARSERVVYVWSIPALTATLPDGTVVKTCPNAGVCAGPCYARYGTYRFRNVVDAHTWNLQYAIEKPEQWEWHLKAELARPRYRGGKWVRIHDSGDFFAEWYARAWLRIAEVSSDVTFYAYTKEVSLMKRLEPEMPYNFLVIYSLGGREDHLIDLDRDRHADVFPDAESLAAAGYHDQGPDDRLAPVGPIRVGIVANNIPPALRRQAGRSFGEWQASRRARA
jgi:hypothetical protein